MCQHMGVVAALRRPFVQSLEGADQTHHSRLTGVTQVVPSGAKQSLTESELLELVCLYVESKTGRSVARGSHFIKIMPAYAKRGTTWRIFHSGLDVRCGAAVDEAESELTEHYDLQSDAN
jgi:hypothetical protein